MRQHPALSQVILNSMGQHCLDFVMERDVPASRPVPTLEQGMSQGIPIETLTEHPIPIYRIVSCLNVPQDIPPELESLPTNIFALSM